MSRNDLLPILIVGLSAVLRLLFLEWKPPHFDEGINGWFANQILERGYYLYDPTNYHGPLHFYLILIFKTLFGKSLTALRMPAVIFGILTVWLLTKWEGIVPKPVAWLAALFVAISPAMVFYCRYSIHESEFVFFTLLFTYGIFKNQPWVWLLGFLGALLTKETWTLMLISFIIAAASSRVFPRLKWSWPAFATTVIILFLVYSGFLRNPKGIISFFEAYMPWFHTGMKGNGHEKPVTYWFTLFQAYEWIGVLGMIFSARYLFSKKYPVYSFFSVFGVVQFILYSWIPYKTPWCMPTIIWPFLLMAAFGLRGVIDDFPKRKGIKGLCVVMTVVLCIGTLYKTIQLNFFNYADEAEPYAYVQTFNEIKEIRELLSQALTRDPKIKGEKLVVMMKSQWPLPWVLDDFTNSLYYTSMVSKNFNASLIFCDLSFRGVIEKNLTQEYYYRIFKLRPAMEQVVVYFSRQMFENEVRAHAEEYQLFQPGIKP